MGNRATVFIGSSREGLTVATMVEGLLRADFETLLWSQGLFLPGTYPLEDLEEATRRCSFAVIVGTADDVLSRRGAVQDTVRDNLVFELGMFIGVVGRRRAFLLVPNGTELALPSDVHGWILARYDEPTDDPKRALESMQVACGKIRDAMTTEWGKLVGLESDRQRRLSDSRRMHAVRRLHRAVVQLRDLVIELPSHALAALPDRETFETVLEEGVQRIRLLYREWEDDAELVGVRMRLQALSDCTEKAVRSFPYPEEAMLTRQSAIDALRTIAVDTVAARSAGAGTKDAVGDAFGGEIARRLESLHESYVGWWSRCSKELREAANALHDELTTSALVVHSSGEP